MNETQRSIIFAAALLAIVLTGLAQRARGREQTAAVIGALRARRAATPPLYDEMGMGPGGRRSPLYLQPQQAAA